MRQEDPYRLHYHLMPPTGWLNDPNGLCQKDGITHVYFQYAPDHADGSGKKCWGHYTSRDLLSWEYQGIFLAPDEDFDRDGVYSGCAFTDHDGIHIFYTGNVKEVGDYDYVYTGRRAAQVLVDTPDGFQAAGKEVLLANEDYPDFCTLHVRDPKVWEEDGTYYMVLGARIEPERLTGPAKDRLHFPEGHTAGQIPNPVRHDAEPFPALAGQAASQIPASVNQGAVLLYESKDMHTWAYAGTLTTKTPFGYMWECPDYMEFGDQAFLSISPQGLPRGEYENQNIYQSGYCKLTDRITQSTAAGKNNVTMEGVAAAKDADIAKSSATLKSPTIQEDTFREWDMGFDFYAPQTYADESGRRILIAWMGLPDIEDEYANPTTAAGWQHALTIPREITYRDGVLCQQPIEELKQLRKDQTELCVGKTVIIDGESFEIEANGIQADRFLITLNKDLQLQYQDGIFTLQFLNNTGAGRTRRKAKVPHLTDIRILADTSSIEVFLNHGSTVFTTRYYPVSKGTQVTIEAESKTATNEPAHITLWKL